MHVVIIHLALSQAKNILIFSKNLDKIFLTKIIYDNFPYDCPNKILQGKGEYKMYKYKNATNVMRFSAPEVVRGPR